MLSPAEAVEHPWRRRVGAWLDLFPPSMTMIAALLLFALGLAAVLSMSFGIGSFV